MFEIDKPDRMRVRLEKLRPLTKPFVIAGDGRQLVYVFLQRDNKTGQDLVRPTARGECLAFSVEEGLLVSLPLDTWVLPVVVVGDMEYEAAEEE